MSVLITGSNGFLGQSLCFKLLSLGTNLIKYDIANGQDILNIEQLERSLTSTNIHTVIHLAAVSDLNLYEKYPVSSYEINVIGTRNVLQLCNKLSIRLLFASTCCVYGNSSNPISKEEDEPTPTELYAESKVQSENEILETGLPHTIMRLSTFYGHGMRQALATAIFLDKNHNNKTIEIHGDGLQTRMQTYVTDIVDGIITILKSPPTFTIVNIASNEQISVLDIISIAEKLTNNKCQKKFIENRKGQIYKANIDTSRLTTLGFLPKISFVKGMELTYQFYLQNGSAFTA
jgi:UDP-glucose 4-epimerase